MPDVTARAALVSWGAHLTFTAMTETPWRSDLFISSMDTTALPELRDTSILEQDDLDRSASAKRVLMKWPIMV
jgi:hypothetical protein